MPEVYCIHNKINKRCYVGWTSKTAIWRFSLHVRDHKTESSKNKILYKSMRKHGVDNFVMDVIFTTKENELARELEEFCIKEFELNRCCFKNGIGLNMTDGGEGVTGYVFDDKTKKKMSESAKSRFKVKGHPRTGSKMSSELKAHLSLMNSGEKHPLFGKKGYWHGKTRSVEWRNSQSEKMKKVVQKTQHIYAILYKDGRRELAVGLREVSEKLGVTKNKVINWVYKSHANQDFRLVRM